MPKRAAAVIAGLALIAAAAGCSSSKKGAGSPAPSSTPSAASSSATLSSGADTTSPSIDIPTDSTDTEPTDTGSTGPGPVPTTIGSRPLSLSDAFSHTGNWMDGRYAIGSHPAGEALGDEIRYCSNISDTLEFRLANRFTTLRMNAGQDENSASSDETLVVAIVANGKQVDTRRIKFGVLQPLTENVTDVNALKILVSGDGCTGSTQGITAVISNATLS